MHIVSWHRYTHISFAFAYHIASYLCGVQLLRISAMYIELVIFNDLLFVTLDVSNYR